MHRVIPRLVCIRGMWLIYLGHSKRKGMPHYKLPTTP